MNELDIEGLTISLLQNQGYAYCQGGKGLAPDNRPLRASKSDVVLKSILEDAVRRLNPSVPESIRAEAVQKVVRLPHDDLIAMNATFHNMLTSGVIVNYQKDGMERGEIVHLMDFANPENNDFLAVNQFTVMEGNEHKRPDIVLFVNGLPLVVFELKNAIDESATIEAAWKQLQTYKETIPSLLAYNALLVISDGLVAKAGSLTANYSRFLPWKSRDGISEAGYKESPLEVLVHGLLNKNTLLDCIRFFTVFERTKTTDKNGQISIRLIKKIAAYHQYYAVDKAVVSTLEAAARTDAGRGKAGVIWHTQGSGKSLSMVFFTAKISITMDNPTIVVLTDRNDLDDQLFETFASAKQLLRQEPKQAESRAELKELLHVVSGGIVFSTMQKFQPEEGNVFDCLTDRKNVIVMTDEAHRTQYGFGARTIQKKVNGKTAGLETVYGFAKYLRDALPNATYLGFTGTPIEGTDVNTPAVFGNYIDIYDIAQSVEDGATVPIYYESRLVKLDLLEEGKKLIQELDEELEKEEQSEADKARTRRARLEALVGSEPRQNTVARDIVAHFEERQKVLDGKGMIVCMSRAIAANLYDKITAIRPEWHNEDVHQGKIKVVITTSSSDGPELNHFHTRKEERRLLAERMKDISDELQLVIVCDMWLTGFDVPCLHTMYIDKPMKGHTLMQAIARVNRVFGNKPGGLLVDYLGIAADLKNALAFYNTSGGGGDIAVTQEKALDKLFEKLDIVQTLLHSYPYESYFTADTKQKLEILRGAEDFILGMEDGKKRFIDAVQALSAAFALSVPHPKALAVAEQVGFFQAVKACLIKLEGGHSGDPESGSKNISDLEESIKQVIDQSLVSEDVVDIFDAAGIKKPDISIISDKFLAEIRTMPRKNLALEVLKKLLNDEITARSRKNLIQSKNLLELLENSLKKYRAKSITAAEVIEELIRIGKEVTCSDKEAEELGLTEYEYAFYTAVADNESARDLMGKEKLRELAVVLTESVRKNATIDWSLKESVRAQLRVTIKRILRKYGYPPDMQALATENVMKQAEMIAEDIV